MSVFKGFRSALPVSLNLKYLAEDYLNTYSVEIIISCLKAIAFAKIIWIFGLLYGFLIIVGLSNLIYFILKKFFKLEKLNRNDLLLLGFNNTERNIMISVFFFEKKFDTESIKEMLIEKGIKANEKLQAKVVRLFSTYYWKQVNFEEAKKRVRIVKEEIFDKDGVIKYMNKEFNIHFQLDKEMPYEFQLIKYKGREGGAVVVKLDHTLSDGLGMVTFTTALCDNYDMSYVPQILKILNSTPVYVKLYTYLLEIIFFPYYGIKLFFYSKQAKSAENPFKMHKALSGKTVFSITDRFEFKQIHQINKKLKISFNDLILCILSSAIGKFCDKYYPERKYAYEHLVCGIPIGIKAIPKNPSEVKISNDILCSMMSLKKIKDPLTEFKIISRETNNTIKNALFTNASKYLFILMNEFIPYKNQKDLARSVAEDIDLAVSNMAGAAKQFSYCGCEVDDIIPCFSVGYGKVFFIVLTYDSKFRIVVNLESNLDIDIKLLTSTIEEEIKTLISKIE